LNTTLAETSRATSERPTSFALTCGLSAVLLMWAVNYMATSVALEHLDVLTLVAFRFEIAGVVMLAIYFCQKRRVRIERRHIRILIALAFFGVMVNQGLFTTGLAYTLPSHSAIIVALDPILILALARAMGIESLSVGKVVGMAIAFAGIALLEIPHGQPGHGRVLWGDSITLGAAIGFSIYTVLAKRVTDHYDTIALNTFNCVGAAIAFLPIAIRQAVVLDWKAVAWQGWAGVFYMALFSSVAAYMLYYWALRHMDPSRVAVINYLQPILVIVAAAAFLSERPSGHLLLGTAVVLAGVYLAEQGARIV
jgi:drug/metabolite transporter (DMT)-like permease